MFGPRYQQNIFLLSLIVRDCTLSLAGRSVVVFSLSIGKVSGSGLSSDLTLTYIDDTVGSAGSSSVTNVKWRPLLLDQLMLKAAQRSLPSSQHPPIPASNLTEKGIRPSPWFRALFKHL